MVTAGARGQVCAVVRYTPKQVKMLERVYSECPKPSWQAAAHQGLPHPQQHQAQAD